MHTINRLLILSVLTVFLVPLGLTASLLTPDTDEQIQNAQENAQGAYRESASLNQNERVQKRILTESEKKLRLLEKQKRAIRLQLSEMLKTLKKMNGEASDLLVFQEHSFQVYSEEKDRLGKFFLALVYKLIIIPIL
jgi:septal ring factor EnvC (AmiA/AmiB activator)